MAVPKRKTTPSRRGARRSHDSINVNLSSITFCNKSGSYHRRHHATADGFYKGKKIVNNIVRKNA